MGQESTDDTIERWTFDAEYEDVPTQNIAGRRLDDAYQQLILPAT
jgi:hypothetical protein